MRKTETIIALVLLALLSFSTVRADEKSDTVFLNQYKKYTELYNSMGNDKEFYEYSKIMLDHYRQADNLENYYRIRLNEALYDADHEQPYRAIQKANQMLIDMKADKFEHYDLVYLALGTVFEQRANYRMAEYYFKEAAKNTDPNDEQSLIIVYSQLAYLYMFYNPEEAKMWNQRYAKSSLQYPQYQQVYLFIESVISFAMGNKQTFKYNYNRYLEHHEAHKEQLDEYGSTMLEIIDKAVDGHYRDALQMLDNTQEEDMNDINLYDLRIRIFEMMGNYKEALKASKKLALMVDSLNTGKLFNNLNEINAQAGIAKIQSQASEEKSHMLVITTILLLTIIALLCLWIYVHKRMRERLIEKNRQLETALNMAEESDKMKTEFVRQVSHEIRTPLNAITGFNQILNGTSAELSEEEKNDLLTRIEDNIKAITNMVDEMLHMAEKNSTNYYPRSEDVLCNKLLSDITYKYRDKVSSSIELAYTTDVINRFTIRSNEEGIRQIMDQLLQNAIKFTDRGHINVHCKQSEDQTMVEISVEDTGRGISEENQSKIFGKFFKVDQYKEGIGLGLTVSKKIAQKLGGDIALDPTYTTGSRFVLTLPVI